MLPILFKQDLCYYKFKLPCTSEMSIQEAAKVCRMW